MATERQIAANRRNAQLSTGPTTPAGKNAVRLNALRHGLLAEHVILPAEHPEDYNDNLDDFLSAWLPRGAQEEALVNQIAEAFWRLRRARQLESFHLEKPDVAGLATILRNTIGIERFDRRWADEGSWLIRLPQEDLCQATATPAHAKYEADGGPGIDRILELLNGSTHRVRDRENFFRAQLLFWLMSASTGLAKWAAPAWGFSSSRG